MSAVSLGLGQKSKAGTSVMEIASRPLRNHLYRRLTPFAKPVICPRRREVRRPSAVQCTYMQIVSRSSRPVPARRGERRKSRVALYHLVISVLQFPRELIAPVTRRVCCNSWTLVTPASRNDTRRTSSSTRYFNLPSSATSNERYRKFANCNG